MTKRIGVFCLPGRGHLYPATALGQHLKQRGYEVVFFGTRLIGSLVSSAGLSFSPLDPSADLRSHLIGRPHTYPGPCTLDIIDQHATLVLAQAHQQLREQRIEALLIDQAELAASSIAELLDLPFASLSFFPPVYLQDETPPFVFGWPPSEGRHGRRRNRRGNNLLRRLLEPTLERVNSYRRTHGLKSLCDLNDVFSKQAILSQVPATLDFPRKAHPSHLMYTAQWVNWSVPSAEQFPWHRLSGKPIVYVSLGTVRSESPETFATIAAAVAEFDVQLVISLGGMKLIPEDLCALPNDSIVVHYAPQRDLLDVSSAAIYHGGMNTTLEAA
jgi:zeaxanthin glucosyltransferase